MLNVIRSMITWMGSVWRFMANIQIPLEEGRSISILNLLISITVAFMVMRFIVKILSGSQKENRE